MVNDLLVLGDYVKRAPNRYEILKLLGENDAMIPSEISRHTGIHINNVSRHLSDLREKGLVYLLNPSYKIGRLYGITILGVDVLDFVEKY